MHDMTDRTKKTAFVILKGDVIEQMKLLTTFRNLEKSVLSYASGAQSLKTKL